MYVQQLNRSYDTYIVSYISYVPAFFDVGLSVLLCFWRIHVYVSIVHIHMYDTSERVCAVLLWLCRLYVLLMYQERSKSR